MTNKTQTTTNGVTGIVFNEDAIKGTFLEVLYDELVCNSDESSDGIAVFAIGNADDKFTVFLTLGGEVNYDVHAILPYSEEFVEELGQMVDKISSVIETTLN